MKILIAADMEGISGVVHWDQVDYKQSDYARFRKIMTAEVNAAIRGAFDGGAEQVIVADGHGRGRNILIEELDRRARLNSSGPSPLSMVQGVDQGVDAAMFVGYHARAGTNDAILDHTWTGAVVDVRLNGQPIGETGLNAAVCGHFDAPVLLVTGDQSVCAEAADLLGPVETAIVKRAAGRMAAECLPPAEAQERIYRAARRAVERYLTGEAPAPFRPDPPLTLTVEWAQSQMADRAAILPGARRLEGRRVEFTAADALEAYRAFRSLMALARD